MQEKREETFSASFYDMRNGSNWDDSVLTFGRYLFFLPSIVSVNFSLFHSLSSCIIIPSLYFDFLAVLSLSPSFLQVTHGLRSSQNSCDGRWCMSCVILQFSVCSSSLCLFPWLSVCLLFLKLEFCSILNSLRVTSSSRSQIESHLFSRESLFMGFPSWVSISILSYQVDHWKPDQVQSLQLTLRRGVDTRRLKSIVASHKKWDLNLNRFLFLKSRQNIPAFCVSLLKYCILLSTKCLSKNGIL